jgi:hypothetical protein
VDSAKYILPPDLIVSSGTKQGSVTVPEIREDAQLALLPAISAYGDSTDPDFISTNKPFEKTALEAQHLFEGHVIPLEWSRELSSLKHCLLTGLRGVSRENQ